MRATPGEFLAFIVAYLELIEARWAACDVQARARDKAVSRKHFHARGIGDSLLLFRRRLVGEILDHPSKQRSAVITCRRMVEHLLGNTFLRKSGCNLRPLVIPRTLGVGIHGGGVFDGN